MVICAEPDADLEPDILVGGIDLSLLQGLQWDEEPPAPQINRTHGPEAKPAEYCVPCSTSGDDPIIPKILRRSGVEVPDDSLDGIEPPDSTADGLPIEIEWEEDEEFKARRDREHQARVQALAKGDINFFYDAYQRAVSLHSAIPMRFDGHGTQKEENWFRSAVSSMWQTQPEKVVDFVVGHMVDFQFNVVLKLQRRVEHQLESLLQPDPNRNSELVLSEQDEKMLERAVHGHNIKERSLA